MSPSSSEAMPDSPSATPIFCLMLAIAARDNPQWSLKVFVSRQVVFYTSSFVTEVVRADRLGYAAVTQGPAGQIVVYGEPGVKVQPDTPAEAEKAVGFHFTSGS